MGNTNEHSRDKDSEESRNHPDKADNYNDNKGASRDRSDPSTVKADEPNPARTTTGKFTAPKFGSAGSGGAELDPGPERA